MVTVIYQDQKKLVEAHTVEEALLKAGIVPEEVVVKRGKTIIPDTEHVQCKDVLEVIRVISGG